jgi:hypothetical protein
VIGVAQLINKVLFARRLQVSKNIYWHFNLKNDSYF